MRVRFAAWFCLCTATAGAALADEDAIVLRVGGTALRATELAARLARTPDYQLARYGKSTLDARKGFVDQVIVPELLLAEEARARKLEQRPALGDKIRDALKSALERSLREEVASKSPVTPAEIKTYFDSNHERFETPRRIRIWRILVADAESA
ncbi:MAG TPA: peptidylprolyl isomerase, partial [Polyangiaceae bacterium]|nr:peptidylprolyl isomerase [Polyangiaceae bacterium]